MGVEYPPAVDMFVDRSRVFVNQNTHYAVVIHKTACGVPCNAQDVANDFAIRADMASTHFVIGQDGTVVQCVQLVDGAAGNCCVEPGYDTFWSQFVNAGDNLNTVTISIEHCDPTNDNSTPVTSAQKSASFSLVKWLCDRYHIPPSNIKTHASIAPESRARCPGNYPMDELIQYIQGGGDMSGVPQGWKDDGSALVAPNGQKVVHGFRQYILDHSWDPANYPLEQEKGATPLEESNTSLGGGAEQTFRMSRLEWQSQTNQVIYGWLGQEYLYILNDRNTLKAALTKAQQQLQACQQGLPQDDIKAAINSLNKLLADLNALVG